MSSSNFIQPFVGWRKSLELNRKKQFGNKKNLQTFNLNEGSDFTAPQKFYQQKKSLSTGKKKGIIGSKTPLELSFKSTESPKKSLLLRSNTPNELSTIPKNTRYFYHSKDPRKALRPPELKKTETSVQPRLHKNVSPEIKKTETSVQTGLHRDISPVDLYNLSLINKRESFLPQKSSLKPQKLRMGKLPASLNPFKQQRFTHKRPKILLSNPITGISTIEFMNRFN